MIHKLKTLRKLDDLRISSLATHLASALERIEELEDDRNKDRKRITKLVKRLDELEEAITELEDMAEE